MKSRTIVIIALIAAMLAGVLLQAQGALEIRAASATAVQGWQRAERPNGEALWVSPETSATAADIAQSDARKEGVALVFTPDGARKMAALTKSQAGKPIALLLDGKVIWAPVVRSTIEREAMLSGLSPEQAQRLAALIK